MTTKSLNPYRWTVTLAASEWGINPKTLGMRIKTAGIVPGSDGLFSTREIDKAIHTTFEAEKTRLTGEQADIAEIKKHELRGELVPVDVVEFLWASRILEYRERVLSEPIDQKSKENLLSCIPEIKREEYFSRAIADVEEVGSED